MTDLYDTLGVPRHADDDEIRAAWRRLCAKHHPDKGGDAETMAAINRAYETLGDPAKRDAYDATGRAEGVDDIEAEARSNLVSMFSAALDGNGDDIIATVQGLLGQTICQLEKNLDAAKRKTERLTRQRKRVRAKQGSNLFQSLCDQQIGDLGQQIARMQHGRKVFARVGEMLDAYEMEPREDMLALQMKTAQQAYDTQQGFFNPWKTWSQT